MLLTEIFTEAVTMPGVGRKRPARPRVYFYCYQSLSGWPADGERFWVTSAPAEEWDRLVKDDLSQNTTPTGHTVISFMRNDHDGEGEYEVHAILANSRAEADDAMRKRIGDSYAIKDLERYKGMFAPETTVKPEYEAWTKPTPRKEWDADDFEDEY